jgi:hypothetical protein
MKQVIEQALVDARHVPNVDEHQLPFDLEKLKTIQAKFLFLPNLD